MQGRLVCISRAHVCTPTRSHVRTPVQASIRNTASRARRAAALLSSPLLSARRGRQTTNRAISPLHGPRPLKCLETVVSSLVPLQRPCLGGGEGECDSSLSLSLDSLFRARGTVSDETFNRGFSRFSARFFDG